MSIIISALFAILGFLCGVICSSILRGQVFFLQALLLGGFSEICYILLTIFRTFGFEGKFFRHAIVNVLVILLEFVGIFGCILFIVTLGKPFSINNIAILIISALFACILVWKSNHDGKIAKKMLES